MTVKPATKARRVLLTTIIAGSTVLMTGCSSGGFSLASMNPFSKPSPSLGGPNPDLTQAIASAESSTNPLARMGAATKNAMGKTTSAVTGMFSGKPDQDSIAQSDPLSLGNKPKAVDPAVFVANGQLWESSGDMNKAMESYTTALEQKPKDSPALISIARLHFRQNKFKEAADAFRLAIAQNPDDAGLHNDLGLTLSKTGDVTNAMASLRKSLELAPGTSRYANNLATIQFENGNSAGAFQVLEQNNKPAVAHFNMAYLHYKNGQAAQARNQLNQALAYKAQAGEDAVVQRAIERSHDMLAQIDGTSAPIAQAAPQATIAGGRFFQGPAGATVRQTSQSGSNNAAVSQATQMAAPPTPTMTSPKMDKPQPAPAPAVESMTPPKTTPTMDLPKNVGTVKPGAAAMTSAELLPKKVETTSDMAPKKVQWGQADVNVKASANRPMPIKPRVATPTTAKTTTESKPDGFQMPSGFNPSGSSTK